MRNIVLSWCLVLVACTNAPKPIAYGTEGCHYCSMTIVDKQHAAQVMTKKGRSYAFDAAECMLNHLQQTEAQKIGLFLVNDYYAPGEILDATKATYLISENIPSPMGAFLSAFASREAAQKAQSENQGELLTWNELVMRYTEKTKKK